MNLSENFNYLGRPGRCGWLAGVISAWLIGCGPGIPEKPVAAPVVAEAPAIDYVVHERSDDPLRLEVEACIRGFSTRRFALLTGHGIEEAHRVGRPLIVEGGRAIPVDSASAPRCVTYRVQPSPNIRPGLLDDGAILVRPEGAPRATAVRVEIAHGVFATPYASVDGLLRPRPSFFERSTTWARVGEGALHVGSIGAVEVRLAILPGARRISDEALSRYILRAVKLASDLAPTRYPDTVLIAVAPGEVPRAEGPIAFGQARRGGGASVLFVLDEDADEAALVHEDWVALHELSHFAFPAMPRSEAWLTEGWATYFQELLRGRGGLIEPDQVFRRMHRGFSRGRAEGTGRPLHREAKDMRSTYAFKRVYWAGAARALEDDVLLHARGTSLSEALHRAFEGAAFDAWISFEEYLTRLERAGHPELAARARAARAETGFPDVSASYEALGLVPRGAALELEGDEASVTARSELVSGAP